MKSVHPFTQITLLVWALVCTVTLPIIGQGVILAILNILILCHHSLDNKILIRTVILAVPTTLSLLIFHGWIIPEVSFSSPPDPQGWLYGLTLASRIALLMISGLLFVYVASPSKLMSCFGQMGLSVRTSYLLVSPLLLVNRLNSLIQQVTKAQQARGFNPGQSTVERVFSMTSLIVPVVVCALSDLQQRAIALDSRGFHSTRRRTTCFPCPDTRFQSFIRLFLLGLILMQCLAAWYL